MKMKLKENEKIAENVIVVFELKIMKVMMMIRKREEG
jgi:hypothetical protein